MDPNQLPIIEEAPDSPEIAEAKIIRDYLAKELELMNVRIENLKRETRDRYSPRSGDNEAPSREEIIANTPKPDIQFHEIVMEARRKAAKKGKVNDQIYIQNEIKKSYQKYLDKQMKKIKKKNANM